jgi:hypothetical protein
MTKIEAFTKITDCGFSDDELDKLLSKVFDKYDVSDVNVNWKPDDVNPDGPGILTVMSFRLPDDEVLHVRTYLKRKD